jgi:hypothetical protein
MTKETEKHVIEILNILFEDAEMALNGDWDRSDEGFEAQITLIDECLTKIENDNRKNKDRKNYHK